MLPYSSHFFISILHSPSLSLTPSPPHYVHFLMNIDIYTMKPPTLTSSPLQYFTLLVSFLKVNQSLTLQTHVFTFLRAFVHKVAFCTASRLNRTGIYVLQF